MHLYIHIPYCISKCDYCDFFSIPLINSENENEINKVKVPELYVDSLINEINYRLSKNSIKTLSTVYIGGGTPSLLTPFQIEKIMTAIKKIALPQENAEITIEMNPETVTEEKLDACRKNGINRISLGIQSLCNDALSFVHRHCTAKKACEALDLIKQKWTGRLSLDVIAGLPQVTEKDFFDTLEKVVSYNPDHISMYALCIEEGTVLEKKLRFRQNEISETADNMWLKGREFLKKKGYSQYEVSNFCIKQNVARHNVSYWNQEDYIGCGSGACGTFYSFNEIINQTKKGYRFTNTTDLKEYISFWSKMTDKDFVKENQIPGEGEILELKTEEFEYLMLGLRTLKGIDSETYAKRFSSLSEYKGNLSERLGEKDGIWKKYYTNNYTKVYKNIQLNKNYSLNEDGILFLSPLLEELID